MAKAGNLSIEVTEPHPCWCHLIRNGERILSIHHSELRDLQYVVDRALADAARKLGPDRKDELL